MIDILEMGSIRVQVRATWFIRFGYSIRASGRGRPRCRCVREQQSETDPSVVWWGNFHGFWAVQSGADCAMAQTFRVNIRSSFWPQTMARCTPFRPQCTGRMWWARPMWMFEVFEIKVCAIGAPPTPPQKWHMPQKWHSEIAPKLTPSQSTHMPSQSPLIPLPLQFDETGMVKPKGWNLDRYHKNSVRPTKDNVRLVPNWRFTGQSRRI